MRTTTYLERAYAKINLTLDITGKLPNGYHSLKSIMLTVSAYDIIFMKKASVISVTTSSKYLPNGEKNIAYKAAAAFFEHTKINGGLNISIKKVIPTQAGLGGGSADAAAVLRGLNHIYAASLSDADLCAIGASVGADVPFCLKSGLSLCEGIGDKLTRLDYKLPDNTAFVIVKASSGNSTPIMYEKIDNAGVFSDGSATDKLLKALEVKPESDSVLKQWLKALPLSNDFDAIFSSSKPSVDLLKQRLSDAGAVQVLMSGSGSAFYGLFESFEAASRAETELRNKYAFVKAVSPVYSN